MFRAQANPMDESVVRASDENLTSENWEYIFDVVDKVQATQAGPSQAVSALIKRLAHRNANVQLYTLELANALSQNCGPNLHRELASKAFTDALLRLASDRNTHAQVKQKVLERMGEWSEEFGKNPELGIMEQAYQKLRVQQPGLMPPSKPVKAQISQEERRKEDEELQMALKLSVQDKGPATTNGTSRDDSEPQPAQTQPSAAQGTTAATVSRVRALYDFTPSEPGELAFRKNDIIAVLESVYKDWWKGSLRGNTGIFPLNYVEKLQDPTKEEIERDAQMEAEVFGEIKNVEKLLALLSVRSESSAGRRGGEREEEEISDLYQRTLSIRPKLAELIVTYSQKKDDFTQLNEKFIKARRDYEALLESSMTQPQYQHQQQYPIRQPQQRQSSYNPYPQQQQQPPYGGQQQGYPPQGPPSAQGYAPQQPLAQQSQQHLPPQQDVQRFYSPAPSEPPSQQQPGYGSPYPQQNAPPSTVQQQNGPAPFHFIPGGIQGPPAALQTQSQEIRRKPSPQVPISAGPGPGPSDPYGGQPQAGAGLGSNFQGQIRPNSIHTLNSGNPQELAGGGYESPVDNRHSYPNIGPMSPQHHQGQHPQGPSYDGYPQHQQQHHPQQQLQHAQTLPPQPSHPPPQQPQQHQRSSDRDTLPSHQRQRTHSFESPTSVYSSQTQQQSGSGSGGVPPWEQAQQQPGSPQQAQYQAYQAYQPQQQQIQGQRLPSGGSSNGGGGDPGDFYR